MLSLGFLAFPLYWSFVVLLIRSPSLSKAVLKPAFYIQCLYLSPLVTESEWGLLLKNHRWRSDGSWIAKPFGVFRDLF